MTHEIRTDSGARDEPVRQAPRTAMNIPAQLTVHGRTYEVLLQNISRFGAFVTSLPAIAKGTVVELAIASQGPGRLATTGTVVHWLDEAAATRVGSVPGAGIRFQAPIDELDTEFAAAVTCLLVQQGLAAHHEAPERGEKPTRRMLEPVRSSLVAAMNLVRPEADGRIVFAGSLAVIALADLLTTLALRRTSGRLELEREHITATVELSDGDIVGARSSVEVGDAREVMWMTLLWSAGSFRLLSAAPCASEEASRMKVTDLLIEHVRLHEDATPVLPTVRFRPGSNQQGL